MFELVEEALDAITFRWDDDVSSCFCNLFGEMICIVGFVCQYGIGLDAFDKVVGQSDVVALSWRADQADRQAERFRRGMDFGAQSAA